MKYITKISGLVIAIIMSLSMTMAPVTVLAAASNAKDAVCEGAGVIGGASGCDAGAGAPDANTTLKNALNLFSVVIGIIAVVMLMIGGLKFMTSQGDPSQTNSAKNTIIFAAVGIVIVVLAQTIVRFILGRFS